MRPEIATESASQKLLQWYRGQKRDLPWRKNREPYRVWLSEVMLQQTTVQTVIPYYEKFIARFPDLQSLAKAEEGEVLELWAGLGYYSRARNLLKAARELAKLSSFPRQHQELVKFPGFGPYTARAVTSIAFNEPVGVLDGNVIRVMTRLLCQPIKWWLPQERAKLQVEVDHFVQDGPSSELNQALMELGATICTPTNSACLLCPIRQDCRAFDQQKVAQLPLKRPRREREIWAWQPVISLRRGKIAFIKNDYAPFVPGQLICPGTARRLKNRPGRFDFRHSITHHDIFVSIKIEALARDTRVTWIHESQIKQRVPLALVHKALAHAKKSL